MAMKMIDRQVAGVTVVDISGRIVLGEDTALLRNTIRDLISLGKKKMVLNLGEVPYMDSSGIGELVSAIDAVRKAGGDVKLLNLTKRVSGVAKFIKLGTICEMFDDEAAAIKSFNQPEDAKPELKVRAG